jgi:hypothetical protein
MSSSSSDGMRETTAALEHDDCKSYSSNSNSIKDVSSQASSSREEIAKRQTTFVAFFKRLVIGTMIFSSAIISANIYISRRNGESAELNSQLLGTTELLKQAFVNIADVKIEAMASLRVSAVSQGIERNGSRSWPFVTIPNFQERAKIAHDSSKSIFVSIHPVVTDMNRRMWEQYVLTDGSSWM